MNGRPTLIIDLHAAELLKAYLGLPGGVEKWNALMQDLGATGLVGRVWSDEADEPGVVMGLSMEGADFSGLAMPEINLNPVFIENCLFDRCDMRGMGIGMCRGCSFRGADLRASSFTPLCDLTDADFTGATTDASTVIERGLWDKGHAPKGLHERLLACCKADPAEVRQPLVRTKVVPIRVDASLFIPASFR